MTRARYAGALPLPGYALYGGSKQGAQFVVEVLAKNWVPAG